MTNHTNIPIPKNKSWQMFDAISSKYDLLNHLLSFGIDILWRRELAEHLVKKEKIKVLDLATGTGDVLITFCEKNLYVESAVGIDMSKEMLKVGQKKLFLNNLAKKITLQHGDANHIPFENGTFDNVSIAFGIRNVEDPSVVLKEMQRTLKKGGKVLILEFSLPKNGLIRALHLFYLRTIVPCIGGLIAGHYQAYKYLNQTIEQFPYGDDFLALMDGAGLKYTRAYPLLFGVATIYTGEK